MNESKFDNTLGYKLRALRTMQGFKQTDIADYLGISPQAYSLYEKNERRPKLETLKQLAEFFNVNLVDLIEIETQEELDAVLEDNLRDLNETALIREYRRLNEMGQDEAYKRVQELTEIPRYRKDTE